MNPFPSRPTNNPNPIPNQNNNKQPPFKLPYFSSINAQNTTIPQSISGSTGEKLYIKYFSPDLQCKLVKNELETEFKEKMAAQNISYDRTKNQLSGPDPTALNKMFDEMEKYRQGLCRMEEKIRFKNAYFRYPVQNLFDEYRQLKKIISTSIEEIDPAAKKHIYSIIIVGKKENEKIIKDIFNHLGERENQLTAIIPLKTWRPTDRELDSLRNEKFTDIYLEKKTNMIYVNTIKKESFDAVCDRIKMFDGQKEPIAEIDGFAKKTEENGISRFVFDTKMDSKFTKNLMEEFMKGNANLASQGVILQNSNEKSFTAVDWIIRFSPVKEIAVSVQLGDATDIETYGLVVPSNKKMEHKRGLGKSIECAADAYYLKQKEEFLKQNGEIPKGKNAMFKVSPSNSGSIKAKNLIFVHIPLESHLKEGIEGIIQRVSLEKLTNVAIPAIGCGNIKLNINVDERIQQIVEYTLNSAKELQNNLEKLKKIIFFGNSEEQISIFKKKLKEYITNNHISESSSNEIQLPKSVIEDVVLQQKLSTLLQGFTFQFQSEGVFETQSQEVCISILDRLFKPEGFKAISSWNEEFDLFAEKFPNNCFVKEKNGPTKFKINVIPHDLYYFVANGEKAFFSDENLFRINWAKHEGSQRFINVEEKTSSNKKELFRIEFDTNEVISKSFVAELEKTESFNGVIDPTRIYNHNNLKIVANSPKQPSIKREETGKIVVTCNTRAVGLVNLELEKATQIVLEFFVKDLFNSDYTIETFESDMKLFDCCIFPQPGGTIKVMGRKIGLQKALQHCRIKKIQVIEEKNQQQ